MNKMARLFSISNEEEQEQQAQQELINTANNQTSETPEVIDGEKASNFSGTIVIAGYPSLGKSTYCKEKSNNSLDLESSIYSRNQDGTMNEEFPGNYINTLKWHLVNMNWKYIFTACKMIRYNLLYYIPLKIEKKKYLSYVEIEVITKISLTNLVKIGMHGYLN